MENCTQSDAGTNRCILKETVWCAQNELRDERDAKRCAHCNRKGADVTWAEVEHYCQSRRRQLRPPGSPMVVIRGVRFGQDAGPCKYGNCVDEVGDGCLVYYIEEDDFSTHCAVFPEDYTQGNSSGENDPIDLWITSNNLMTALHSPVREVHIAPSVPCSLVLANTSFEPARGPTPAGAGRSCRAGVPEARAAAPPDWRRPHIYVGGAEHTNGSHAHAA